VELTAGQYLKYLPGDVKKTGSGAGGTLYWQHRDHLQSVRVVTKADGSKDDGAVYRPYGEQLGFAGSTPQTKGFIGQRLDDKSGLMYLHARYYDPVLGRFIQADPSDPTGVGVGVNRYAYAGDNPIAYLDPSGLGDIGHNGGPPLIDPEIGAVDEFGEFDGEPETESVITQQEHEFDQQLERLSRQTKYALLGMAGEVLIHNTKVRAAEAAEARLTAAEDAIAAKSTALPDSKTTAAAGLETTSATRLRDPKTGRFVSDPANPASTSSESIVRVHGNSLNTTKTTYGYTCGMRSQAISRNSAKPQIRWGAIRQSPCETAIWTCRLKQREVGKPRYGNGKPERSSNMKRRTDKDLN